VQLFCLRFEPLEATRAAIVQRRDWQSGYGAARGADAGSGGRLLSELVWSVVKGDRDDD
jgi:hypothetical protein